MHVPTPLKADFSVSTLHTILSSFLQLTSLFPTWSVSPTLLDHFHKQSFLPPGTTHSLALPQRKFLKELQSSFTSSALSFSSANPSIPSSSPCHWICWSQGHEQPPLPIQKLPLCPHLTDFSVAFNAINHSLGKVFSPSFYDATSLFLLPNQLHHFWLFVGFPFCLVSKCWNDWRLSRSFYPVLLSPLSLSELIWSHVFLHTDTIQV